MSDFTKEELQHIRFLINNMNAHLLTADKAYILVQSKIQSMIDNYCEPENKAKAHEWSTKYTCMKCGELIE